MKTVKVVIERSKDMYSASAENIEGIYGGGETVPEAKQSIINAIALYKKYNTSVPAILKNKFDIVYKFDAQSFLNYYRVFTQTLH